MKVVSDTSPIYYLFLIEQIHLLPALWGNIIVPEAVISELSDSGAPEIVRDWIVNLPEWLKVRPAEGDFDQNLNRLHPGEREAIMLALNISADLIVLDEKTARETAKGIGLNVTGLLGILDEAATRRMINLPAVIERLSKTSFRASPSILKIILDRHSW